MGQKNALWWDLPARESLELNRAIYGIDRKEFEATVEELIVLGYVTHVLQHRGPFFAITISTCIRLSYHLYQGPLVMIIVIPMGVLFGIIYWRYRNLWPFMLAHAFYDLMILAP